MAAALDPDRPPAVAGAELPSVAFLVFRVRSTWFACSAAVLQRVEATRQPVPVPGTPRFVLGVLQSAGRIVCVLDLALLLQVASPEVRSSDVPPRLLVLTAQGLPIGVTVDEVAGIFSVPAAAVQRLDGALPATGRFPLGERVVTLLDATELLQLAEDQVGGDDEAPDARAR